MIKPRRSSLIATIHLSRGEHNHVSEIRVVSVMGKDHTNPMKTYIKNSSKGFSLIEMIGVLAIIGILASVVAPKVFDAIRDGKITAAVAVLQTIKSSCTDYARKYNVFPTDGTKAPVQPYIRPYGDGATITAAATANVGDILISEGMLEKLNLPIGPSGATAYATTAITLAATGAAGTKPANAGGLDYPVILCRPYSSLSNDTRLFSGAQNSTRVIFLLIPGLTTLEAAGLKTKVDGPFNETISGPADLISQSLNGTAAGAVAEAVNRGNCLIVQNADGATFDCFIYVAHD